MGSVGMLMPNCAEVALVFGVARRSAITLERMLAAPVCDVALRFVCTPTGINPKTAIKAKPAIPMARVNSTRENADVERTERFIAGKFLHLRRGR